MKKLFVPILLLAILFEIANVYFIMPMPGSQTMNSIGLAYFLFSWRWVFRIVLGILLVWSAIPAFRGKMKVLKVLGLLIYAAVIYLFNFKMTAESMFVQPSKLLLSGMDANKVEPERLIMGVNINGQACAYPIQYLGYHHQVRDTVGGQPIMVTYCTVCRTGRVYKPLVDGKLTSFRLVGMDHFNAMFEDAETKSWWRQSTGECVAGTHKGKMLEEVPFVQVSLKEWTSINPETKIMQPASEFAAIYKMMDAYESGKSKGTLTGTNHESWKDKSWVLGITLNGKSKAYDWNTLKSKGIINDKINGIPVVLTISSDHRSFYAFKTPSENELFEKEENTIKEASSGKQYQLNGKSVSKEYPSLTPVPVYQEFWHSWRTFHPNAEKYQ